jgi:hypothetical protein
LLLLARDAFFRQVTNQSFWPYSSSYPRIDSGIALFEVFPNAFTMYNIKLQIQMFLLVFALLT